jgi:hypothetical protein
MSSLNIVPLDKYMSYLKDISGASPHTLKLFTKSLHACKLGEINISDLSETWRYLLKLFESKQAAWGYIVTCIKIVKAAYKLETGHEVLKEFSYNELSGKLNKYRRDNPNPRVEYTRDEVELIMRLCWEHNRATLFPAVVLMSLSGLRIGGCAGLKFSGFRDAPNVPGVKLFEVHSKGAVYTAAISSYGYNLLEASRNKYYNRDKVVYTNSGNSTDIESTVRTQLRYLLVKKFNLRNMLKDKPMLHAFRKFAITQMASVLHKEDIALLAGHKIVGSTAYKYYVAKNTEKPTPQFEERIARAYAQTPLMQWRLPTHNLKKSELLTFKEEASA